MKIDQLLSKGDAPGAEALARRAVARYPSDPRVNYFLAVSLWFQKQVAQCEFYIRRSVELEPSFSKSQNLLGQVCMRLGKRDEAIERCRRACELDPGDSTAWNALGAMYMLVERAEDAYEPLQRAYQMDPTDTTAAYNFSGCLADNAQTEEGCAVLAKTLDRYPDDFAALQTFAAMLNYPGGIDPQRKLSLLSRLGEHFDARAGGAVLHRRPVLNHDGPLRVGIISADFRTHSCAFFLTKILRHLPDEGFEITCYDSTYYPDKTTSPLVRSLCPRWTRVLEMSDEQLARTVAKDGIDIIIDTGGHTSSSRVGALAWRPAPVAINYLGYPASTGMRTIDYRLVDAITDPPGSERWCTEKLLRIDGCFLCYDPITPPPPPRAPRINHAAPVRFGSFNATKKVCRDCVELWSKVLQAVPDSTLFLKGHAVPGGLGDRTLRAGFESHGIDPSRITIMGKTKEISDHLRLYDQVDIALDTFPYHGTTTTIEALMMGVPVVTRMGEMHVSRVSGSLLSCVGLPELCAQDDESFVRLCADLAGDGPRVERLHSTLRDRVMRSPLCNGPDFAGRFARALRQAWHAATHA